MVVEILCKRRSIGAKYPKPRGKANILCYGYTPPSANQDTPCYMGALETAQPVSNYPNSHINTLKSQQWERLLVLIGRDRMFKLLLSNSIFLPLGEDKDKMIYYQLCGKSTVCLFLPELRHRSFPFMRLTAEDSFLVPYMIYPASIEIRKESRPSAYMST